MGVEVCCPSALRGRLFKGSAPKYRGMKGLVRKYYLFDDQNRAGGGVYLWKSRADADAVYTPQWKVYIAERYGAPPDIRAGCVVGGVEEQESQRKED